MEHASFHDLELALGNQIDRVIAALPANNYDEDFITRSLASLTEAHLSGEVSNAQLGARIESKAFKATGTVEQRYGDLAVLVHIETPNPAVAVEGVAFLEAKKRGPDTIGFPAWRTAQARRIHKRLWNSKLLVYDHVAFLAPATAWLRGPPRFAPGHPYYSGLLNEDPALAYATHAAVVPMGLALSVARTRLDTTVYRYAVPLSTQIVRYLHGLDLEHEDDILDTVRGSAQERRSARYVLVVSVGYDREPQSVTSLISDAGYLPLLTPGQ